MGRLQPKPRAARLRRTWTRSTGPSGDAETSAGTRSGLARRPLEYADRWCGKGSSAGALLDHAGRGARSLGWRSTRTSTAGARRMGRPAGAGTHHLRGRRPRLGWREALQHPHAAQVDGRPRARERSASANHSAVVGGPDCIDGREPPPDEERRRSGRTNDRRARATWSGARLTLGHFLRVLSSGRVGSIVCDGRPAWAAPPTRSTVPVRERDRRVLLPLPAFSRTIAATVG